MPRRGDGGRLRVVVWNLGDTAKTGTVEVAGGRLAGLPARPFALGPRGTPPSAFDAVFQSADDDVFDPDLVLRGVFNSKRGSRTCVPVWLEERFFAGCEEKPLAWRNLDAWRRNDSAGKSMVSWDESEDALGLEAVREFRLGANPNGRKVTFWVRNLAIWRWNASATRAWSSRSAP